MNSWASAAAKQLFQSWRRSGVGFVPKFTHEGTQQATAWLEEQNLQLGIQEAARLGLHAPPPQKLSAPASSASPPVPTPVPTPTTPATPIAASHVPASRAPVPPTPVFRGSLSWSTQTLATADREERFRLLSQQVASCKLCTEIACRRNKTVFGTGPTRARIVVFGEAPGADEDRSGEPFVGAAGQLLDKILVASGLHRDEVYIMNSLKCRPPNNRNPTDSELQNCRPFFETQLETIQPEYIICWGAVAVRALLDTKESVGRLRGRFHPYKGAKVLVTYHPAYLLRNPEAKKLTWDDMKFLMKELGIAIPAPKRSS